MNPILLLAISLLAIKVSSAPDKSQAVGPCVNDECPPGHFCFKSDNECYPGQNPDSKSEKDKKETTGPIPKDTSPPRKPASIGTCVNGLCPDGYECRDNTCFKVKSFTEVAKSIGPCVNNKCPDGFGCKMDDYQCYAN